MKLYKSIVVIFSILIVGSNPTFAQSVYNKVGGVAFRIDDHQTAAKWRDFNRVFKKYGFHYSLGIDIQRVTFDTSSVNALKEVVADGNELMDHTPYGNTCYLWVYNLADTLLFIGHPGLDHINKNRICLKTDSVITTSVLGEGLVDLVGDKLISRNPGEFKNMYSPAYYSNIYLPGKNKICAWFNLQNLNSLDPDTVQLRTYWQETFPNDTAFGIPHHRLTGYDIKMTNPALNLLVERSLFLYDSLGFPRPLTWVQPGGSYTQLSASEVKQKMGLQYGYTAAATYVNPSYKMYNEVDSFKNKRYAIQNPDITDETSYFQALANTISDNSARHLHSFSLGHFVNLTGGWDAYLGRIDSLLNWCKTNEIPVKTVNEWASIMFDSIPNPHANALPDLYRDLNKNGIPDGMVSPFGTFDSTDGVARSKGRCISRTGSGSFFGVNIMGGVEKGWNRVSVYTKGMPGDSIRISINFSEIVNSYSFYNLAANTTEWKEVSTLAYIDPKASRVTYQINALKNNIPGTLKISGMQLRKQSNIRVVRNFSHKTNANIAFSALSSTQYIIDSFYKENEYQVKPIGNFIKLTYTFDTLTNIFHLTKPSIFWMGMDSIKIRANNPDKTSDSAYIHFISQWPSMCIGDSIWISADATFGSNFVWLGQAAGNGFWTKPIQNTWYKLQYKNKSNQTIFDSLFVQVNTVKPSITLVNQKTVCYGKNLSLSVPNAGTIKWYNDKGIKIQDGASFSLNNMKISQKFYVSNAINSCVIWDTVQVDVNPLKRLTLKLIVDTTIMNVPKTIVIPGSNGLSGYILNTPINQFIFNNGSVLFNPNFDFYGRDSARIHITDDICSHDTIWVKIYIRNTIGIKEYSQLAGIKIYPNPANHFLTLTQEIPEVLTIHLSDMTGRLIFNQVCKNSIEQIDISGLSGGLYFLQMERGTDKKQLLMVKE